MCPPTSRDASSPSARSFFILPEADREAIAMRHGGAAWRGWFPIGGELTSSVPDRKEGIYFGAELGPDDPRVVDRAPAARRRTSSPSACRRCGTRCSSGWTP